MTSGYADSIRRVIIFWIVYEMLIHNFGNVLKQSLQTTLKEQI